MRQNQRLKFTNQSEKINKTIEFMVPASVWKQMELPMNYFGTNTFLLPNKKETKRNIFLHHLRICRHSRKYRISQSKWDFELQAHLSQTKFNLIIISVLHVRHFIRYYFIIIIMNITNYHTIHFNWKKQKISDTSDFEKGKKEAKRRRSQTNKQI